MSARKGQITDKIIDREYPHQVAMIWPDGGAGLLYDGMNATANGLGNCRKRGLGSLVPGRVVDGTRWCFQAEQHARVFQAVFGGDLYEIQQPTRPGGKYVPVLKIPASNSGGSGVRQHSGPAGNNPQRYSRPDEG